MNDPQTRLVDELEQLGILRRLEFIRARMHAWNLTTGDPGHIDVADPTNFDPDTRCTSDTTIPPSPATTPASGPKAVNRLSPTTSTNSATVPVSTTRRITRMPTETVGTSCNGAPHGVTLNPLIKSLSAARSAGVSSFQRRPARSQRCLLTKENRSGDSL